jgi:hypothetical protein
MSVPASELIALTQQLRALTDATRTMVSTQSNMVRETYAYSTAVKNASSELEDYEDIVQQNGKVSKEQSRIQQYLIKAKKDEIFLLKKLKQEQQDLIKINRQLFEAHKAGRLSDAEYTAQRKQAKNSLRETIKNLASASSEVKKNKSLLNGFGVGLGGASRGLNILVGFLSMAGGSLVAFNTKFMDATTKASGVIEATASTFDGSMAGWITQFELATGVASQSVLQIMAQNRQTVNSMGGMRAALDTTESSILSMRGFYGTLEDSMRANIGILTMFGQSGVKPTQKTMEAYNKDLTMLSKQTGMAATEINNLYASIASDSDSLSILRAAREGEREAILANQRALVNSNIALGMTSTQAEDAAKMLNKMVAAKPLERFKQAARLRAAGAIMGVDTNAAADELMKPKGQQNFATINKGMVALSTKMGAAPQQGELSELMVGMLGGVLKLDEIQQTFDNNFKNQAKSQQEVAGKYQTSADSAVVAINNVADIGLQAVSALLNGTIFWASAAGGISELVGGLDGIKGVLDTISNFFDRQVVFYQDLGSSLHNIGEYLSHPFKPSERKLERTDRHANMVADQTYNKQVAEYKKQQRNAPIGKTADEITAEFAIKNQEQTLLNHKKVYDAEIASQERARKDGDKIAEDESKARIKSYLEEWKKTSNTTENEVKAARLASIREQQAIEGLPLSPAEPKISSYTTGKTQTNTQTGIAPSVSAKSLRDPILDSKVQNNVDSTNKLLTSQVTHMVQQETKIDLQLKQMTKSAEYLKIIADTNPKLVELAEKQLAVSTMTQEQRDRTAKRMSSESSKFSADYSYAT